MIRLLIIVLLASVGLRAHPAMAEGPGSPIWVDTDAACIGDGNNDVDDCLALLYLARQHLNVIGVSSVFGNTDRETTDKVLADLLPQIWKQVPPTYKGARHPADCTDNAAAAALARSAKKQRLTILAIGPLTNIACLFERWPTSARRIDRIVVVMGARAGELFHPAEDASDQALLRHGLKFSDLNFAKDKAAARTVLNADVAVVLVPYESARWFELTAQGLKTMAASGGVSAVIAERSQGWLSLWQKYNGRDGFYPFDLVAAMTLNRPILFTCSASKLHIEADQSIGMFGGGPTRLLMGALPWKARSEFSGSLCIPQNHNHVTPLDVEEVFNLTNRR